MGLSLKLNAFLPLHLHKLVLQVLDLTLLQIATVFDLSTKPRELYVFPLQIGILEPSLLAKVSVFSIVLF